MTLDKINPMQPFKNVAVALIFAALLGPVGMLYASFWGAIFMILVGIVVFSNKFIFPMILLWIVCCIWSVAAVERYNRKTRALILAWQQGQK